MFVRNRNLPVVHPPVPVTLLLLANRQSRLFLIRTEFQSQERRSEILMIDLMEATELKFPASRESATKQTVFHT